MVLDVLKRIMKPCICHMYIYIYIEIYIYIDIDIDIYIYTPVWVAGIYLKAQITVHVYLVHD